MRHLMISASSSCFTACFGCYNHFAGTAVQTPDLLSFCDSLRHHIGLSRVTVAGGDPLARPDILSLLEGLKFLGLHVVVDTVGLPLLGRSEVRFMSSGWADEVDVHALASKADMIGIPLDGSSDSILTQFRRFTTVAKQRQILDLLFDAQASVCVNTVVHQGNISDLEAIRDILSCYPKLKKWQVFQYMPSGPLGFRHRRRFEISEPTFSQATCNLKPPSAETVLSCRSNSSRKNRYILMDGAGTLWCPEQTIEPVWDAASESEKREIVGHMTDIDIIAKLLARF